MSDHVIVCGYGTAGRAAARDLADEGVSVVVVDKAAERVGDAESDGHLGMLGDVLDPEVLKEAGVERARGVILLLPSESDNLFATMTGRELNPDVFIIAAHTSSHARAKLVRAGADRAVNPFEEGGEAIGSEFVRPALLDLMRIFSQDIDADQEVRVREITLEKGSELVGTCLKDADIRGRMDIIVIAMRKEGDSTRFNPDPTHTFRPGDVLVCMGKLANLKRLHEMGRGVRG